MFKKLMPQQMGFVNLQLIIMITLVIVGIGAVGSYVVLKSKALTPPQIRLISKLEPSAGSAGSKIIIYGDRSLTDTYKININGTMGVAKATSKDGGKSLLFTFPASSCPMGQTCNQAAANPGWYTISVTDSRNQTSYTRDFNLEATTNH